MTIDELKSLMQTDCKNENIKRAFLFSCLTGLRFSDVSKAKWSDLHKDSENKFQIEYQMQKTKKLHYLSLSNEALKWLPEKGASDLIFQMPRNDHYNETLANWVKKAGITKKITFHCSRHTNATLNLTLGVPIEVVSKLLGHSKISTTQIYADIINKAKREAVDKQNGIFD